MTAELVDAWRAWEKWNSKTRKARWRYAKGSQPPSSDRVVSARLTSAVIGAAIAADIPHMELHNRVAEGRRDGLSVEQAVCKALQ